MSLKTSTEPMEDRQLALTVEVDQARVDQELRKAARKLARQYRIPGFRKGKAPYPILVKYLGLPTLFNEFIEPLGEEIYRQALEQEEIEPYAQAALDIEGLEPLTYKLIVPLEPEVDLGDYRSLRLDEDEVEITDEEIDEDLNAYRDEYAAWTDVDRPAEYGDMLTIDVRSVIVEDGESDDSDADDGEDTESDESSDESADAGETVVLDETDWDVTLDEESPLEPPGFDDLLLGMSPGEDKESILTWPEDSQSIYAGKQARLNVAVHSIQAYEQPPLDDEFAQMVGPDFETIDALRESVRDTLMETKREEAENLYLEQALDALVEQSTLVYPPVVVEDQIDSMVDEFQRQLRSYGIEDVETYLSQVGQEMADYRENLREQAEIAAKRNLVISELYQQEGLEVEDEDIDERIREMVGEEADEEDESTKAVVEMMRSGSGRAILESQILQQKSLDCLLAIVRGEELPEPAPKAAVDESNDEAADDEVAEDESGEDAEDVVDDSSADDGAIDDAETEEEA